MPGILRILLVLLTMATAGAVRAQDGERGGALAAFDAGDYAEAARIWRQRAAAGDTAAMVALAGLYEAGLGVPRDPDRALALYRAAAADDDATARRILERHRPDGR